MPIVPNTTARTFGRIYNAQEGKKLPLYKPEELRIAVADEQLTRGARVNGTLTVKECTGPSPASPFYYLVCFSDEGHYFVGLRPENDNVATLTRHRSMES